MEKRRKSVENDGERRVGYRGNIHSGKEPLGCSDLASWLLGLAKESSGEFVAELGGGKSGSLDRIEKGVREWSSSIKVRETCGRTRIQSATVDQEKGKVKQTEPRKGGRWSETSQLGGQTTAKEIRVERVPQEKKE